MNDLDGCASTRSESHRMQNQSGLIASVSCGLNSNCYHQGAHIIWCNYYVEPICWVLAVFPAAGSRVAVTVWVQRGLVVVLLATCGCVSVEAKPSAMKKLPWSLIMDNRSIERESLQSLSNGTSVSCSANASIQSIRDGKWMHVCY